VRSVKEREREKYGYLGRSKREEEELEEEVKKNIEYLEQTSSVIYKNKEEAEQENFTFSNQQERARKVTKLGVITDSKAIRTCQFAESGNYFAVGTNSSVLKIFDVQRLFARNAPQELPPLYQIDNLHAKSIFCLQWASNERSLATCSNDLSVPLPNPAEGHRPQPQPHRPQDHHRRQTRLLRPHGQVQPAGDPPLLLRRRLPHQGLGPGQGEEVRAAQEPHRPRHRLQTPERQRTLLRQQGLHHQEVGPQDQRARHDLASAGVRTHLHREQRTGCLRQTDRIVVSHRDGNVSFFNSSLQLEHAAQIHEQEIRSVEALRGESTLLTASFDGHVALFTEDACLSPSYFQHNDNGDDKVVFATFLHSPAFKGFASTSTQGLCHLYSYH
jgi:WD40 repeat protein